MTEVKYLQRPFSASVFITHSCNIACCHCIYECSPQVRSYISLSAFNTILRKLIDEGVVHISLTGGEPTVHPHFIEIIKMCYDYTVSWSMLTNGINITPEIAKAIARYEPLKVLVSLHGPDKETHEFICGPGTFEKALNAVKLLHDEGIRLVISTVLHRKITKEKLIELLKFAESIGAKASFVPLYPAGRALRNWFRIALNPNELRSLIQILEIEYHKHIREQEQTPWILSPPTCGAARTFLSIDEQGYAYPCDFFVGTDFRPSFSLLDKDVSLGSIWFSMHFELVRKILIEQSCILAFKCPIAMQGKCRPCPALSYRLFRNIFMPNPKCVVYQWNIYW